MTIKQAKKIKLGDMVLLNDGDCRMVVKLPEKDCFGVWFFTYGREVGGLGIEELVESIEKVYREIK